MATNTDFNIFISYANKDGDYAEQVADKLRLQGFSTWIDRRDLVVGQPLNYEIERALRVCDAMVLVSSGDAWSRQIENETTYAAKRNIPLFTAWLDKLQTPAIPEYLQKASGVQLEPDLDEGVYKLSEMLHSELDALQQRPSRVTVKTAFTENNNSIVADLVSRLKFQGIEEIEVIDTRNE